MKGYFLVTLTCPKCQQTKETVEVFGNHTTKAIKCKKCGTVYQMTGPGKWKITKKDGS